MHRHIHSIYAQRTIRQTTKYLFAYALNNGARYAAASPTHSLRTWSEFAAMRRPPTSCRRGGVVSAAVRLRTAFRTVAWLAESSALRSVQMMLLLHCCILFYEVCVICSYANMR